VGSLAAACAGREPVDQSGLAPVDVDETPVVDLTEEAKELVVSAASGPDPLVCRKGARVGTHMRRTVCYRQSELDAAREDADQFMRESREVQNFERLERAEQAISGFPR
jgi:hypothetical protein